MDDRLKSLASRLAGAQPIGFDQETADLIARAQAPVDTSRTVGGTVQDIGVTALKGAIGLPESFVGIGDIITGGQVGNSLESAGYRPSEAKSILDEFYSQAQQAANQRVQEAEGFTGKVVEAVKNPSVIAHTVGESLPAMFGGGAIAKGLVKVAPKVFGIADDITGLVRPGAGAAAIGEGVVGGGMAAESIRAETPDRLLTPTQSGLAALSGAGTTFFGALGAKASKWLKVGDVDVLVAGGTVGSADQQKSALRRFFNGMVAEGALEELPQSIQEQVIQNVALGKDIMEGVDHAAALGLLSGAAMGGPVAVLSGGGSQQQTPPPGAPPAGSSPAAPAPPSGPLSRALTLAGGGIAAVTPTIDAEVVDRRTPLSRQVGYDPSAVTIDAEFSEVLPALPPPDDRRGPPPGGAPAGPPQNQQRALPAPTTQENANDLSQVPNVGLEAGQALQGVQPQGAVEETGTANTPATGLRPEVPGQGIPSTSEGRSSAPASTLSDAEFAETLPKAQKAVRYNGQVFSSSGDETHSTAVKKAYQSAGDTFDQTALEVGFTTPDGEFITYDQNGKGGRPYYNDGSISKNDLDAARAAIKTPAPPTPLPAGESQTSGGATSQVAAAGEPVSQAPAATPNESPQVAALRPLVEGKRKPVELFTVTDEAAKFGDRVFVLDHKENLTVVNADGTTMKASPFIKDRVDTARKQGKIAKFALPAKTATTLQAKTAADTSVESHQESTTPVESQNQPNVRDKQQPGDITKENGSPFPSEKSAKTAHAARKPLRDSHEVVKVGEGAYVIRAKPGKPQGGATKRKGAVGMQLASGEVVTTLSGRETTPFPNVNTKTNAGATKTMAAVDRWLLENAALEAESRGDEFNASTFRADLRSKTIPQASKDSAEMYLFEQQPDVVNPITKPLSDGATNNQTETKPEPKAEPKKDADKSAKEKAITRRDTEQGLYASLVNDADILTAAGGKELPAFTKEVEAAIVAKVEELKQAATSAEAVEAYSELVADGRPVLPEKFFAALHKQARKAYQERQKEANRDPEEYRKTLEWGMGAKGIFGNTEQAAQYKTGFDHALKGKTRSTLPQGEKTYLDGYADARAWLATESGKAWFEGKRREKATNTGDALRRTFDRMRSSLDEIKDGDAKKVWANILKLTTRADLFMNLMADDATPGATELFSKFRAEIATFQEYFMWETVNGTASKGRRRLGAEDVFTGRYTSYQGRFKALDYSTIDVSSAMAEQRDKASKIISDLYDLINQDTPPSAENRTKQQAVIKDDSRWLEFIKSVQTGYPELKFTGAEQQKVWDYFRAKEDEQKRVARLAETKKIAAEYQESLRELSEKFTGAKTVSDMKAIFNDLFPEGKDKYITNLASISPFAKANEALFMQNDRNIRNQFVPWYATHAWERYEKAEDQERATTERKQPLTRPRLDRIVRSGLKDHRAGKDVTAADMKYTFNFADITIGNYVTAQQAQDHLNYSYDAFMTLAELLGCEPRQLSFDGKLHFAIGALGHGSKAAATFHPAHPHKGHAVQVINVTNTKGDGTVLHEYFHAIDFMTTDPKLKAAINGVRSLLRRTPPPADSARVIAEEFLAGRRYFKGMTGRNTPKMQALYALQDYYKVYSDRSDVRTDYAREAAKLDTGGGEAYWSNDAEIFARMAEAFGYDELTKGDLRDDYLVTDWVADGKAVPPVYRGTPYPRGEERIRLVALFRKLVDAITWTDAGPVLKKEHPWQTVDPYQEARKPFVEALDDAARNIDAISDEMNERKTEEAEARRRKQTEATFGTLDVAALESEIASDDIPAHDAPEADPASQETTEDELSSIFDEALAELQEAGQEETEADAAPGAKIEADPNNGWTIDDIRFLRDRVEAGEMILLSGNKFAEEHGIPTIHYFSGKAEVSHLGFGAFRATNDTYTVTWTAGGSMSATPGGQAFTTVSVEKGLFAYPKNEVMAKLTAVIAKSESKQKVNNLLRSRSGKLETDEQKAKRDKGVFPTNDAQAEKTAAELAKEMAKFGVQGIDEALKGLVSIFGGGQNKLQSFPGGGFNEDSYKQAKPHFEAAASAFHQAGLSFRDFIKIFFKALIQQFGPGVKEYAVRFAKDYETNYNAEANPAVPDAPKVEASENSPSYSLALWVKDQLAKGQSISWQALFNQADALFGGTQAQGVYTPKDAYDAMELALNLSIVENLSSSALQIGPRGARQIIDSYLETLKKLPTQSKRTAEMDEFQQFSTPPNFAYLVAWAANLGTNDVMLEPSAGVGGLAAFAKAAGVKEVIVNELSSRRLALLRTLPFDRYFGENAEQIDNILPDDVKPTVVLMNPPFSATAGRIEGRRDTSNGGRHIEQALARLEPGGRLIAIVGEGMADNKPAQAAWWNKIKDKYEVRANIGIEGTDYAKYGTTFDNQILVIDKTGPTTKKIVTGKVSNPAEAVDLLEDIRNDRPTPKTTGTGREVAGQPDRGGNAQDGGRGSQPDGNNAGTSGSTVLGGGRGSSKVQSERGDGGRDSARTDGAETSLADAGGSESAANGRPGRGISDRTGSSKDTGGNSGSNDLNSQSVSGQVAVRVSQDAERGVLGNSTFEEYHPKKVQIAGAKPHNTPLVESAAMASVVPPDPTYTPNLPGNIIEKGLLSAAQLEAVVYAGQAHEQTLLDGKTRRGFFIGDGTGVGKGREISGIIMDNLRNGRTKAVWISAKNALLADARRDFSDIGGDPDKIFPLAKIKVTDQVKATDGIAFGAYTTLRSKTKERQAALKKSGGVMTGSGPKFERTKQLVDWLGKNFDGVIVFDEAHEMSNAVPKEGGMGASKESQQALAALDLQNALPNARVVYVSATGATEVRNLAYALRLGLWGDGTPFANVVDFINEMSRSVSAMELVAQNLKQMGLYVSRSLSYDGIEYARLEHDMTDFQRDAYDMLAGSWQVVLQNIEEALKITGVNNESGKANGKNAGNIKGDILSAFWGSHQRFFNQIITASAMPSVLEQVENDLKAGNSVVLQLVNTDEAAQNRAIGKNAEKKKIGDGDETETEIEELDLTPRETLIQLVEKAFPVAQMEQYQEGVTESGKPIIKIRPVVDKEGKPVHNREAVAMRDSLVDSLKNVKVPDSALQMLIAHFGADQVAEITGRTQRVVYDEKGKMRIEKRSKNAVEADAQAFKDKKKRILLFSNAGGTGFSFHTDRRYKNQQKRIHYVLQPGWSADKAIQGLGRSHRTNQSSAPMYRLVTTDVPAQKRFTSTIARRLEQLGALTAGQRDTAGGSLFSAADNLESSYAQAAVRQFFVNLVSNIGKTGYDAIPADLLQQMGLSGVVNKETGQLNDNKIPNVRQFLNRLLSLRIDTQESVFEVFMEEMTAQIDNAKALGVFDDGLQSINHVGARVVNEQEVYKDPDSGAVTRFIEVDYDTDNKFFTFDEIAARMVDAVKSGLPGNWFKNKRSGKVAAVWQLKRTRTNKDGRIEPVYSVWRVSGHSYEYGTSMMNPENWEQLSISDARTEWDKENDDRDKVTTHKLNIVVGGILPIWDRFNNEVVKVARIAVDDGRRFLGRVINHKDMQDTLAKLNVESSAAKMSAEQILAAVLAGKTVAMSNRLSLKKVKVSGDDRVEITSPSSHLLITKESQIKAAGGIVERINWQNRYFIPTGENGNTVLASMMKSMGMNAVTVDAGGSDTRLSFGGFTFPSTGTLKRDVARLSRRVAELEVKFGKITSTWKNSPALKVVATEDELPAKVQKDIRASNAQGRVRGVFLDGNTVYLVAENLADDTLAEAVLMHEAIGHYGARALFGKDYQQAMGQLFLALGGVKGVKATAAKYGINLDRYLDDRNSLTPEKFEQMAVDELLAHLVENNVKPNIVQKIMAAIRAGLRRLGFTLEMNDADLLRIIGQMKDAVVKGKGGTVLVGDTRFSADGYDAQLEAVRRRYFGTPLWMKAPNGKPTKLAERQWLQVRTENFKRWFGDWETAYFLDVSKEFVDQVASGKRPETAVIGRISGSVAAQVKRLTGSDVSGGVYELVANDIAHALKEHGDARTEAKKGQVAITADDLKVLPLVLAEPTSIRLGGELRGRQSIVLEKKINGTLVVVEIVPYQGSSMQFKTAWKRPSESAGAVPADNTSETALSPSPSYNERIRQLLEKSKASKVVDENGEPLVVYHGTREEFISFDKEKIRAVDYDVLFNGFWFSTDEETSPAMADAKRTIPAYLTIRNPAPPAVWRKVAKEVYDRFNGIEEGVDPDDNALRDGARSVNDEVRFRLQDMGYDGINYDGPPTINAKELEEKGVTSFQDRAGRWHTLKKSDEWYGGLDLYSGKSAVNHITGYTDLADFMTFNDEQVWIAFEPTQIKSATDNVGTFDGSNPDIRYSISPQETVISPGKVNGTLVGDTIHLDVRVIDAEAKQKARLFVRDNRAKHGKIVLNFIESFATSGDRVTKQLEVSTDEFLGEPDATWQKFSRSGGANQTLSEVRSEREALRARLSEGGRANSQGTAGEAKSREEEIAQAWFETAGWAESSDHLGQLADAALTDLENGTAEKEVFDRFQSSINADFAGDPSITDALNSLEVDYGINPVGKRAFIEEIATLYRAWKKTTTGDTRFALGGDTTADVPFSQRSRDVAASILDSTGSNVSWWQRTVGTMYHLAESLEKKGKPQFKAVFNKGQAFLSDISKIAMKAEAMAPNIFPKAGIGEGLFKHLSKKDAEAISKVLFDGTLYGESVMDGKVFTDAELRQKGLTEKQIGLYREARAAVDQSLDDVTASFVAKYAKEAGVSFDQEMTAADMADDVTSQIQERVDDAKAMLETERDAVGRAIERAAGQRTVIREIEKNFAKFERDQQAFIELNEARIGKINELARKTEQLKRAGYFPLMRFGEHTVTMRDDEGNVTYFAMHESKMRANLEAKRLQRDNPDATVTRGTMSRKQFELYGGINLEALELFAEHLGADENAVYQEYLKQAVNNRSVLKRMIQRQGTAGFNEDGIRTLANFIVSNSRHASTQYHLNDMRKLADAIPKEDGDIKDQAISLLQYLSKPQEEASALRGYLFFHYLGGSIASAMTNMTQPIMMTAPYLSQFASADKVVKALTAAAKLTFKKNLDGQLGAAMRKAEDAGVVAPQEIHQLTAMAANRLFASHPAVNAGLKAWGSLFSVAEIFNRRVTFIAAYNLAVERGERNPYEAAVKAVNETQGIYNKGNRPNWGRGIVGAPLFTFKQFSVMYLELFNRLPLQQKLLMLGILALAGGGEGLPFKDDLDDLIDTLMQWAGFAWNTKAETRRAAESALGRQGADLMLRGVSAVLPLDMHGRLGMGNLLPGTSVLKQSTMDRGRDVQDFFGPAGALLASAGDALSLVATGQPIEAARAAAPRAAQGFYDGGKALSTGYMHDKRGRRTLEVSPSEAMLKLAGFNPQRLATESEMKSMQMQDVALLRVRREEIINRWSTGIINKDREEISAARDMLKEWNRKNPEMKIRIDPATPIKRAKAAKLTSKARYLKALPVAQRQRMADEMG